MFLLISPITINPTVPIKGMFKNSPLVELVDGKIVPATTLFGGQWAGFHASAPNPRKAFAEQCRELGFDGAGVCTWGGQFTVADALKDPTGGRAKEMLADYTLEGKLALPQDLQTHIAGQFALIPHQLVGLNPASYKGLLQENTKMAEAFGNGAYDKLSDLAIEHLQDTVKAAKLAGLDTVVGFVGSNIWHLLYRFPDAGADIDQGYKDAAKKIQPLLKTCEENGVNFALEVHPTEIAFDFHTTMRFYDELKRVDAKTADRFKVNFDPSHFVKQGIDPVAVLESMPPEWVSRIHVKGATYKLGVLQSPQQNGNLKSALNSMLPYGDQRRGSDFDLVGQEPAGTGTDWKKFFEAVNKISTIAYVQRMLEFESTNRNWLTAAKQARSFINEHRVEPNIQGKFDDWKKEEAAPVSPTA